MNYVKTITSNVGGAFSYDLGPKTLIVAPNMGGKSRLIHALSLALRGQGAGEGLGKKETDLMVLKPENDDELFSDVELDTGEVITWHAAGSVVKCERARWSAEEPVGTMVYDLARDVMSSSSNKLRKAILDSLHVHVVKDKVLKQLPTTVWPAMDKVWPVGVETLEVDQFLEVVSKVDAQKRATAKQLKALSEAIDGVDGMTAEQEEELATMLEQRALAGVTSDQMASMKSQAEQLDREIKATRLRLTDAGKDSNHHTLRLANNALFTIRALRDYSTVTGRTAFNCLLCGTKGVGIDSLDERQDKLETILKALGVQAELSQRRESDKTKLSYLRTELDALHMRMHKTVVLEPVNEERYDELKALQHDQQKAEANYRVRADLTQENSDLDIIKKRLKKIETETIQGNSDRFGELVSEFLPPGETAEVVLKEGRRSVCRIYLSSERGRYELRALSGAESAIVVTAIAGALFRTGGEPRLLVIDETWLDPQRIQALMKTIGSSMAAGKGATQAIVCAVQWSGPFPDGWTVLDLRVA